MLLRLTKCTEEMLIKLSAEGKLYRRFTRKKTVRSEQKVFERQMKNVVKSCNCIDGNASAFSCSEHWPVDEVLWLMKGGEVFVKVDDSLNGK